MCSIIVDLFLALFLFIQILCPSTPVIDSRTYGTPLLGSKLIPSPEISPIASVHQRNKSVARLNFSSRMMATDNATTFGPSDSPLGERELVYLENYNTFCSWNMVNYIQEQFLCIMNLNCAYENLFSISENGDRTVEMI